MIAHVISKSWYNIAADIVPRCGPAMVYPCVCSCRITGICVLYVMGTVEFGDTQIIVIYEITKYT